MLRLCLIPSSSTSSRSRPAPTSGGLRSPCFTPPHSLRAFTVALCSSLWLLLHPHLLFHAWFFQPQPVSAERVAHRTLDRRPPSVSLWEWCFLFLESMLKNLLRPLSRAMGVAVSLPRFCRRLHILLCLAIDSEPFFPMFFGPLRDVLVDSVLRVAHLHPSLNCGRALWTVTCGDGVVSPLMGSALEA